MTAILGISAFYHDSAAAIVVDGRIVAAAQEERFSRVKHDASFPKQAIDYCLSEAAIRAEQLDYIAYYEKPLTKFERILETFVAYAPLGFAGFRDAIPVWLKDKLHLRARINRQLGRPQRKPLIFLDHHESHAASAFFPSPFDEAAILTLDGVGEWTTTMLGVGQGNRITPIAHLTFPHSLGLLYSAFTAHCGFEVNDGEYKLMGLAPYGQPVFADAIRKHLIDLKPDGSFRLNMDYFSFGYRSRMTNRRFDRLFGGPPRQPKSTLEQRHADLAASVQAVLNETVLQITNELHRRTKQENLVIAGGVALNCVTNEHLLRSGPFSQIWIQPAAGDAGSALGAALFVWHQLLKKPRSKELPDSQQGSLLGPLYTPAQISAYLKDVGVPHRRCSDIAQLHSEVARALADGKIVGCFNGRMEYGPRALGSRSILADARRPEIWSVLNERVKFREGFRPFAPAVLTEHASQWFDLPRGSESPYMLLTAPVAERHLTQLSAGDRDIMQSHPDFDRRAAVVRSATPAITHVDYSARVQTVDAERNPAFHALLTEFYRLTGCPVLANTSFNVQGEPIVCTPEDAYQCFQTAGLDMLVLEDCIIEKEREQPHLNSSIPVEARSRLQTTNDPPSDRKLREFGIAAAIFLVGLGVYRGLKHSGLILVSSLAACAVLVGIIGITRPRWLAPVFTTLMWLLAPLAWLVSTLLLAIIFFGLLTPLGLLFRLIGRDPLERRVPENNDTYWRAKSAQSSSQQYLKQF